MKKSAIEFQAHPPERRRARATMCCCGCCCCCCCLHTLGGLVGGSLAAASRQPTIEKANSHLGAGVYWKCLGALILVAAVCCRGDMTAILWVVLLGLPFIQLGASVVAALVLAFSSNPEKSAGLKQVGKITLWTFLGALFGVGAMFLLAGVIK